MDFSACFASNLCFGVLAQRKPGKRRHVQKAQPDLGLQTVAGEYRRKSEHKAVRTLIGASNQSKRGVRGGYSESTAASRWLRVSTHTGWTNRPWEARDMVSLVKNSNIALSRSSTANCFSNAW